MGAWIEIFMESSIAGVLISVAPFVGAWIEIGDRGNAYIVSDVAPFVGAWIEIPALYMSCAPVGVAPFVGAWIEIAT